MEKQLDVTPPTIEKALTEYKIPDATVKALAIFKEAEKLECIDADSRKVIGKHRADIKALRPKVNTVRIALNKSFAEKNKDLADIIESALNESYDIFDEKIKAYDSIAEEKAEANRIAKAKVEKKRLGEIKWYMDGLDVDCSAGLEYGLTAGEIHGHLMVLQATQISAVDFDEKTEEAESKLSDNLEATKGAWERAVTWEKTQADAAEEKEKQAKFAEENAAKAKELEAKEAKIKKNQADAQAKTDAAQKVKDDAATKLAEEQAETLRLGNEKLEAGRLALEKQAKDLKAKEDAAALEKYSAMYDGANRINLTIVNDSAVLENEYFDRDRAQDEEDRKAQLKKDKARAKLITHDKKTITGMINVIDTFISEFNCLDGEYKTDEGAQVELDLIIRIKEALDSAEKAGVELV